MKPAITSDDWASIKNAGGWHMRLDDGSSLPEKHAAAALCLHAQPFGFTREDVETLRTLAGQIAASSWGPDCAVRFELLADRIEALLPPEAP